MKSKICIRQKSIEYPCLYKKIDASDKVVLIVLFTKETSGICLLAENIGYSIGHYSTQWNPEHFEPFTEVITLEN